VSGVAWIEDSIRKEVFDLFVISEDVSDNVESLFGLGAVSHDIKEAVFRGDKGSPNNSRDPKQGCFQVISGGHDEETLLALF